MGTETLGTRMKALSQNNTEAFWILWEIIRNINIVDPENDLEIIKCIDYLEEHNIVGSDIVSLYKKVCKENLVYFIALLLASYSKMPKMSAFRVRHAIRGWCYCQPHCGTIDFEQVILVAKQYYPRFNEKGAQPKP